MNNLIDLTNFLNKKKQVGGSYTKVRIWYFKNYNLNPPIEQFDKIYLVTDKYVAYEMNNLIQNNTYFLELNIPNDAYFKFKFMRDDKLEYLHENGVLKGLTFDQRLHDEADAQKTDVDKHHYSWRFIKINDKLIIDYFFSFCTAFITSIGDNIISDIVRRSYQIPVDMVIQKQKNIATESRQVILIAAITLDGNLIPPYDNPIDNAYAQITNHNLGNNTTDSIINSIPLTDIIKYSCYNNNLLLYMEYLTLNNYSKYNTFLDMLDSQTKYFFEQYNENIDGEFYSVLEELINFGSVPKSTLYSGNDNLLSTITSKHVNKYDKTQIAYHILIGHNYLNSYNIKLLDLDIHFDTHIKIVQHPIVELLEEYVFTHLKAALQIHSGKFNKLPLTLRDYKLFFDNYKQSCINQLIKFMFIDMLMSDKMHFLDNSYTPSSGGVTLPPKNDKLEINGISFNRDEYSVIHGSSHVITDPTKLIIINKLKQIKTDFTSLLSTTGKTYDAATGYTFKESYVFFSSYIYPKEYYQDVNENYLLTVAWINKYIAPLVYNQDVYGNYDDISDKSIIIQLQTILNKNMDVGPNTIYKYFMTLYGGKDTPNIDYSSIQAAYKPILEDRVNYTGAGAFDTTTSNDYTDYKDKKYTIYTKMVTRLDSVTLFNDTNNLLSLVPDKISLFTKYFWYNLSDIPVTEFIESISSENQVKLYAKLLVIFSYLSSPNCSSLMTGYTITGNNLFADTSSIEYIKTLEENETINNLIKLSLYHIYTRQINVKSTKSLIENNILNLKSYFNFLESSQMKLVVDTQSPKLSFRHKIDKLPIYHNGAAGDVLIYSDALQNLLNGITNNPGFVGEINRKIRLLSDRINVVNNLDVIKLQIDS